MKLYVARDKNGRLYLYKHKPKKYNIVWTNPAFIEELDSNLFPEVRWEDEEPTEVELVIRRKYESTRINRETKDTR